MTENTRLDKAIVAIEADRVDIIVERPDWVSAQVVGTDRVWLVRYTPDGWWCCDIRDGRSRQRGCYHIEAVQMTLAVPSGTTTDRRPK